MPPAALLLIACLAGGDFRPAADVYGRVSAVYDGDTIRVILDGGRSEVVRLIGIDSPEIDDERESVRLSARFAERYTYTRLFSKRIRLGFDQERRDKYGRLLAYVFLDNRLFNRRILEEGFSSPLLKYPFKEDYRRQFEEAARRARRAERGLWRPRPYPILHPEQVLESVGDLTTVRFRCVSVRKSGRLIFLNAASGNFSALIRQRDQELFPGIERIAGREVTVTGLAENYRGRPQVMLFVPAQLRVEQDRRLGREGEAPVRILIVSPYRFSRPCGSPHVRFQHASG